MAYTLRVNDIPLTTGHGEPIQKQFAFEDQRAHRRRRLPRPALPARPGERAPAEPADGPGKAASTASRRQAIGNGNGDGIARACPPPPYAIALTAGGKVLRFALAPLAAGLDPQGPVGGPARPGVQGRRGRRRRGDRRHGERLPGHPAARVLIFPVTEANVVSGPAKGVTAIKLDPKDRVLGFALANKMREGLTVRTSRGASQIVRATKYPVTGRGGRGYGVLQRGSLDGDHPRRGPARAAGRGGW